MKPVVPILLVAALAGGGYAWRHYGPGPAADPAVAQGYVEGNLVFYAAEESGRIETLAVEAGADVSAGAPLFALETAVQTAQRNEAQARLDQAEAQVRNLQEAQQRPEQIAVLRAAERRARAQLGLSEGEWERQQQLFAKGVASKAAYDQARAAVARDEAAVAETERQIEAAQLPGRNPEIAAAQAAVEAARAALRQAETRLARRKVSAVAAGRVQDVYFRPGEVVNAGQPVLALLPPGNLRVRFYVPEPRLAQMRPGGRVGVTCDRCPPGLAATVSFISREAEYTPPIIFSREERAKLVFRIEARPEPGFDPPLGLPVTVRLEDGASRP